MELEELIVQFILRVHAIFLLDDYDEAFDEFEGALTVVTLVQNFYPRVFGRPIRYFNVYYSNEQRPRTSKDFKGNRKFKELVCFMACNATRFHFYRYWPALLSEIYDEQNRELRLKEIDSFKKICLFFQDVSEYYTKCRLQVIHMKRCSNPLRHSKADWNAMTVAELKIIVLIDKTAVERFKKERAKLFKERPEVKKWRNFQNKRLL